MTTSIETIDLVRRIRDEIATGSVPLADVEQLFAAYLELRKDMVVTRNVNSAYARENERLIGIRLAKVWASEQRQRFAKMAEGGAP